jgi:hypothetical protein
VAITVLSSIISATPKVDTAEVDDGEEEEKVLEEVLEPQRRRGRPSKAEGRSSRTPCAECGSKGTKHFKTCSRAAFATIANMRPVPTKANPFTEEQYDMLKATQEEGEMVSSAYARDHDLPLGEVNVAMFSRTYEGYLKERPNTH